MENESNLEKAEKFRINPQVWLHTLLAIAGDKDRKRDIVQRVAQQTGCSPQQVEAVITNAIKVLLHETRLN